MTVPVQICLITLGFVVGYFALRNMPNSECSFLHYEVTEVLADGTEVCAAVNHAGWLDLTRVQYPVSLELSSDRQTLNVGETTEIAMQILARGDQPILPHELAITHTERLHVMIIDPSLEDYHHVHPEPQGATGTYTFNFNPEKPGTYRVFVEAVPVRTKRQVVAMGEITVSGEAISPAGGEQRESTQAGMRFVLKYDALRRGRDTPVAVAIETEAGEPAELELTMGAIGHMVAFNTERTGYKHMHPLELAMYGTDAVDLDGQLQFLVNLPERGHYRLFAQVKINGQEIFAPFDVQL